MTSLEKAEIKRLPKRYKPITAWGYFWYNVLFAIPVIGTIALIVCAFSSKNIVRRSYARSFFAALLVILIIAAVVAGLILGGFINLEEFINMNNIPLEI